VNDTGDAPDANTGEGVCQTATPGVCTLRAAVDQANVGGGTIQVKTIVDGGGLYRIFGLTSNITISISDMTLRNAVSSGEGGAVIASPNSHPDAFFLINRLFAGGAAPNCPGT